MDTDSELDEINSAKVPHTLDFVGLGAALLPFVVSLRSSSSTTFSATTVDASGQKHTTTAGSEKFKDTAAIGGGALAIIVAVATFALWKKTQVKKRGLRIGLTVGILALGVFQLVVRGGLLT